MPDPIAMLANSPVQANLTPNLRRPLPERPDPCTCPAFTASGRQVACANCRAWHRAHPNLYTPPDLDALTSWGGELNSTQRRKLRRQHHEEKY